MNILTLVLFAVLVSGNKFNSIKEFLARIDFSSFAPVLKLLGFNDKLLEFLCSENFEKLLQESGDVKTLLPLLSNLFMKNPEQDDTQKVADNEPCTSDYLSPIKNVAPTDIEETLSEILN